MKKKAMPIQLDEIERQKLEALASKWGLSLSGVVRRLIREYSDV
ncbi:plasmid copy-number control protein [Calothrix sp. PCC 6303]|nr:plasmid copy-number control protein [Calothrix sp. PCC 6303]